MLNWLLDYAEASIYDIRPIAYLSAVSPKAWNQGKTRLKTPRQLRHLLGIEDERFRAYYTRVIKAVFPVEYQIIRQAFRIFTEEHDPGKHPKWNCHDVALRLRPCLQLAKQLAGYNESERAEFWRWRKLDFDLLKLPKAFKPSSVVLAKRWSDNYFFLENSHSDNARFRRSFNRRAFRPPRLFYISK
jgi:hypothetical protein